MDEKHPSSAISEAVRLIREERQTDKNMKLYIVTNGGFRDISMILNSILSLLKTDSTEMLI